jgi:ABC-2 type transport system ATP-binding protein
MITGLTHPDAGRSTVAGRPYTELANPTRIVGTLLDPTAMHAGRTGRDTLRVAARMAGVPLARADELLDVVGLSETAGGRRVGDYSLGMRQRLGIGQALIGYPAALILDEPAIGLDPEGIAWMRRLLRDFADGGGTVLLSSHLLSEVQATVDHLVVIADGTVVAAGPLTELLATAGVVVRSTRTDELGRLLTAAGGSFTANSDGSFTVDSRVAGLTRDRLGELALQQSVPVSELRDADSTGLEDLFFALTSHDATEAAA